MKNGKLTKAIAALVVCGLCLSTGYLGSLAVMKAPEINGKTAYADGHVYLQDTNDGKDIEFEEITESFFTPQSNFYKYNEPVKDWLMPGGTKDGTLVLKNKSTQRPVSVYLYAASTGSGSRSFQQGGVPMEYISFYNKNSQYYLDGVDEDDLDYETIQKIWKALQATSEYLVDNYLTLEIHRGEPDQSSASNLVYSGKVNGKGNVDSAYTSSSSTTTTVGGNGSPNSGGAAMPRPFGASSVTNSMGIYIGEIPAGESVKFNFKLTASPDIKSFASNDAEKALGLKNGFSYAVAMIDWVFVVSYAPPATSVKDKTPPTDPPPTSPSTSATTGSTKPEGKPVPAPGTGEAAIPYAAGAVACGVSALAIFFIAFGNTNKKRKPKTDA